MTQWHSRLAFGKPRTLIAGAVFARGLPSAISLREIPQKLRGADLLFSVMLVENLFGNNVTTNCYQKDFMPTNGGAKPFVGINLAKNRIRGPQIFSTRKWT